MAPPGRARTTDQPVNSRKGQHFKAVYLFQDAPAGTPIAGPAGIATSPHILDHEPAHMQELMVQALLDTKVANHTRLWFIQFVSKAVGAQAHPDGAAKLPSLHFLSEAGGTSWQ